VGTLLEKTSTKVYQYAFKRVGEEFGLDPEVIAEEQRRAKTIEL
jgi:hypothetical protein